MVGIKPLQIEHGNEIVYHEEHCKMYRNGCIWMPKWKAIKKYGARPCKRCH